MEKLCNTGTVHKEQAMRWQGTGSRDTRLPQHITNNYPAFCCWEMFGKKVPYDILVNYGISYHYIMSEVQHYKLWNYCSFFQTITGRNSVALLDTTTTQFLTQALCHVPAAQWLQKSVLLLGKAVLIWVYPLTFKS